MSIIFRRGKSRVLLRTIKVLLLLVAIVSIGACSRNQPGAPSNTPTKKIVIFVPGFKGTELHEVSAEKKLFWFTAGEALFGERRMIINGHAELGLQGVSELEAGNVIPSISIVPGLFRYNVYRLFLKQLRDELEPGVRVVEFPYDWRQDNVVSAQHLGAFIAELERNGAESISIVAHSMGGLITAYYLRYGTADLETAKETWEGAKHVRAVTIIATPFRGSMQVFHDMAYGSTQGLNSVILDQFALSSFPSVYQLLPIDSSALTFEAWHDKESGSIFDKNNWRAYQWGLLQDTSSAKSARDEFTATYLERAKKFHDLIDAPIAKPTSVPLPLRYYVATGHKTKNHAFVSEDPNLKPSFDEEHTRSSLAKSLVFTTDGDGLVTKESAELPTAFKEAFLVERKNCTADHVGVLECADLQAVAP